MKRRMLVVAIVFVTLGAPGLAGTPSRAQETAGGPRLISGSYTTTNPIYPLIGAETGVLLYDLSGLVQGNFDFQPPDETQTLGTLEGDIVSGEYTITLPEAPTGQPLDFDRDATTPPAVRVFAAATFIEFRGDERMNRGEMPLDLSVRLDPLSFNIIGGYVMVWTPGEGEQFPAGFGADGVAFSADDPLMTLPAGWSVVSLEAEPFALLRESAVDVPIVESLGGLNDYSDMTYLAAWETLFRRTVETYPFSVEKALDWDAIYAEITPLVKRAVTDLDFHLIMTRFGNLIPDTHVGYVSLPVMQGYLLGGVGINRLKVTDADEVVVVEVGQRSVASEAGLRAGDELILVDGTPALQALDETPLLWNSASTPHNRRYLQAATMFQGPVGSAVGLTWRSPGGREHSASLTRSADVGAILAAFGGAVFGDPIESYVLPSGLGYIRVGSFSQEVSQVGGRFAGALGDLMDAGVPGIVLDLRDNSGGLVQLAMAIAGHFFDDYERVSDLYYADGRGAFAYRGFIEVLPGEPAYDGPLAVLVNEMTGSAGDLFVYALQHEGRALVVGETPSGGFVGEVSDGQYLLPGGLQMQVPTGRVTDPLTGQALIEGTGVLPDVRVPRTWKSIVSPQDEVLQAAEAALLEAVMSFRPVSSPHP
jgi:C-terminal processing protease CtpA/Prc